MVRKRPAESVVLFQGERAVSGARVGILSRYLSRKYRARTLVRSGYELSISTGLLEGLSQIEDVSLYALSQEGSARRLGLGKLRAGLEHVLETREAGGIAAARSQ